MELNTSEIISVESVSLQSPFYGKIYFRKECPNNWVSKVKGQVICEGEIIEFGCTNFNCERGGRCGCAASAIHIFTNKPAGSSISVSSQYCYEGQWLEVTLNLVFVGNNQYNLYGTNPATGEYNYFGFVKFIPTQPPITDCDQYACNNDQLEIPDICLAEKPNGFGNIDVCREQTGAEMSAFQPIYNDPEYNLQLNVCYNRQYQRWWFRLNEECFRLNYIKMICEENVNNSGKKLIWDWQEYPDHLSCDEIQDNIFGHFAYGSITGDYVLGIVLDAHEELHKLDFNYIMENSYSKVRDEYLKLEVFCNDSTSFQMVENYFYEKIDSLITNIFIKIKSDWDKFRGFNDSSGIRKMNYEFNTHNSFSIHSFIYNQWYEIVRFKGC
ncbi:hypothetical protein [Ignavibacterium album]|uniref:hypothetical protein n=1 Tax=Ignavibacterium album TaxID=591197 RepID=UPI0035B7EFB9